jgi:murein DD-endopeptidase MepM/ murein hydrolase activator NlpD
MGTYNRDDPPPERHGYYRDDPPSVRHAYDRDDPSPQRPVYYRDASPSGRHSVGGPDPAAPGYNSRHRDASPPDRMPRWVLVSAALGVVLVTAIIAWSLRSSFSPELATIVGPSGSATAEPPPPRVFPVQGEVTYGRTHHGYPATDILAPCGAVVVAAYSGVILEVNRVDQWKRAVNAGPTRGGLSVSLLGDDGVRYYGSHFSAINERIQPGARVVAGEPLGAVGKTGDTSVCHLHFGLSPPCSREGDWFIRRGTIWPWPYLDAWRAGENRDPSPEIQQWHVQNGCPAVPAVEP